MLSPITALAKYIPCVYQVLLNLLHIYPRFHHFLHHCSFSFIPCFISFYLVRFLFIILLYCLLLLFLLQYLDGCCVLPWRVLKRIRQKGNLSRTVLSSRDKNNDNLSLLPAKVFISFCLLCKQSSVPSIWPILWHVLHSFRFSLLL